MTDLLPHINWVSLLSDLLVRFEYLSLYYFLVINSVYLVLTVAALFAVREYLLDTRLVDDRKLFRHPALCMPVSVLVPAYNEEPTVVENVRSLLSLEYPTFEVIVVNDGSRDGTLARLIEHFSLEPVQRANPGHLPTATVRGVYQSRERPDLIVVDKENGGKADALNAGLNLSRHPLVSAIDTDSLLEPNVLLKLSRPFMEQRVAVAAGGVVRIVNGCVVEKGRVVKVRLPPTLLGKLQVIEYLRAFLYGRIGWQRLGMLLIVSGALGMFRRQVIIEAGGFLRNTVGEDMELTVRLHRRMRANGRPYRIVFVPEPVCWTEAPESLRQLGRQRDRWQRGLLDSLWLHRRMFLNPRYGRIGLIAMPFFLVFEGLGPVVELAGLVGLVAGLAAGLLHFHFAAAFLSASILLGMTLSLSALLLEQYSFRRYGGVRAHLVLIAMGLLENFGYRQLNLWWRITGLFNFLRGQRAWGEMSRKGFRRRATPGKN